MRRNAAELGGPGPLAGSSGSAYRSAANEAAIEQEQVHALETTAEVPILMYHSIDVAGPIELAPYRLSPTVFESQLRYLADQGYHSITLDDWAEAIAARRRLVGHPVIITFDDGYLNFLQNAWPLLERTGFTATMFVVTDKVGQCADWDALSGEPLRLMSWDDLRSLRDRGLVIGSHTASHPSLPTLSTEDIVTEGARARLRLQQELGIDATCIAFPYGQTDDRVCEAVAKAGYEVAVGTWGGISTLAHNPLNLPRIEILPDDDLSKFAAKVVRMRPRWTEPDPMPTAAPASRIFSHVHPTSEGKHMLIDPDYAQKVAAQLDTLVGNFVALHTQILNAGCQAPSLQLRLTQLFRQPITGKLTRNIAPYEPISGGTCVGFEKDARVTLEVEPKLDHSLSPESCVNTLELSFTGPSRWLSLDFACEWADICSAQRYQLGIYATVSRRVLGRGVLRLPGKDGNPIDVVFANFELSKEGRNLNKSGQVPNFDFINVNAGQRPTLIVDFDTKAMPDINIKLNYLSVYFD